ncbi:hypothetical protein RHA1_ro07089 [Rhodococcus jostii RHA1]|uniref:Uncharacterized protein n=1 Tax=Rhodococcus jostii (strain RHA1) TaxID=101510 RepID=Q0S0T3_RHOJR|nr:hypothetical protein RHA1_ro07089 [Rhodococcus jostii RHA1]
MHVEDRKAKRPHFPVHVRPLADRRNDQLAARERVQEIDRKTSRHHTVSALADRGTLAGYGSVRDRSNEAGMGARNPAAVTHGDDNGRLVTPR